MITKYIDLGQEYAAVDASGRLVGVLKWVGNTIHPPNPLKRVREPTEADRRRIEDRIKKSYRRRAERRRVVRANERL